MVIDGTRISEGTRYCDKNTICFDAANYHLIFSGSSGFPAKWGCSYVRERTQHDDIIKCTPCREPEDTPIPTRRQHWRLCLAGIPGLPTPGLVELRLAYLTPSAVGPRIGYPSSGIPNNGMSGLQTCSQDSGLFSGAVARCARILRLSDSLLPNV